jgi:hypothetical protein
VRWDRRGDEGSAQVTSEVATCETIEGLKLIQLNSASARIYEPDDPSYPYKLELNLHPPELMQVTFVMLYGGSEVMVVRGMTRDAIAQFIDLNDLLRHPRLRRMTITGPDDLLVDISR